MAENQALTPTQNRAISTILTERNIRGAAKAANVPERTLWRWMSDPVFRAELSRQESALIDQATRRLVGMQETALDAFSDVFSRMSDQAGLNIADFFTEETYTDPVTKQPVTRLVLDIEKIREHGNLVKKLKIKGGEIEVESYDAQDAAGLKLRAAQGVFDLMLRMRELNSIEERIAKLEKAQNEGLQ